MEKIYEYCKKGNGKYNEDVVGSTSNIACVIDGATDVFFDEHKELDGIVHKYVNLLIENVIKCFAQEKDVCSIVSLAIALTYEQLNKMFIIDNYEEYELPTFSIACIKENCDSYEFMVLGDCYILIRDRECITMLNDERIIKFSQQNRKTLRKLKLDPRSDASSINVYKSTRKKANSIDGYPIGSISGKGIKNAITGKISKNKVSDILIYSDGFVDYFESGGIDKEHLFDYFWLKEIVKESENYYENNDIYMKQLRPKQMDDKTIILLKKEN